MGVPGTRWCRLPCGRASRRVGGRGFRPIADRDAAGAFFHVVNTRYEKRHPTIVTTNRGLPDWGQIFGDPVVAAAILDRLMHNAVVFNIKVAWM